MNAGSQTRTNICMYRTQRIYLFPFLFLWASLVAQLVKNPPAMRETWFSPWVGKITWSKAQKLTPVFLPGESPWTEVSGAIVHGVAKSWT